MEMKTLKTVDGGVTAPLGYKAAGVHAGIKQIADDLALLYSECVAGVAATFTTNRIQGAPVRICRQRVADGRSQAVIINSGNANACTGKRGMADAAEMCAVTAELLGIEEQLVLVCSTGTIGVPLPIDKIKQGIKPAVAALSTDGGGAAAKAIMTTDTVEKQLAVEIRIDGRTVRVGGMAKGSGMIDPDMATMLAFLTTDAAADGPALQECLSIAVADSFNRITVDGDRSSNDTVLLLANGCAGTGELGRDHPQWPLFCSAVNEVARQLAFKIVKDGEGATKFVTVSVTGAVSLDDARRVARAVANSLLVKTSWYGQDPNWGRVIDVVGYCGADVREELVSIAYDDVVIVRNGCRSPDVPIGKVNEVLKKDSFTLHIDLNLGDDADTVYTCDCSEEYVRINSEYTT